MNIALIGGPNEWQEIVSRLLIVNDEWSVTVYSHSETQLDALESKIDDLDILLVDLTSLPVPSPEFIQQIKAHCPDVPLLGIHFYKQQKLIHVLMEAGLDGYLHTGSVRKQLAKAVETVGNGREFISD